MGAIFVPYRMRKPDFVAREQKRADWPVVQSMRGSRKFCQRGSKFDFLMGLHQYLEGVSLAGRCWSNIECWLASFVIFQGIRTSIAKKPYSYVISQVVGV